jgi:hypothetical protein
MRFEDTPELFGSGVGTGTCGDIRCDICGTSYNEGEDEREVYDNDSVTHTSFAGLTVCFCCFEKIEKEVLRRMPDIINWYTRLLQSQVKNFKLKQSDLNRLLTQQNLLKSIIDVKPDQEKRKDLNKFDILTMKEE